MKPSDFQYLSGDIGLSYSVGFMSKVIKFMTSWHTKKARMSHSFNMVDSSMIVEATNKIRISNIPKYDNDAYPIEDVYRLPLHEEDRRRFKVGLLERVNMAYGWTKLPLFFLDAVCTKAMSLVGKNKPVFFFTKHFGVFNIPVCSQLTVWALHKFTSYRLRAEGGKQVIWKTISPDYLEDLLKLHHNGATLIYNK